MSFFKLPPPEPPRPSPLRHPWHGPADGVIGHTLALNLVLGRSENAAVWIASLTVYPEGFVSAAAASARLEEALYEDPFHSRHLFARRHGAGELPPELLRLGIEFADGRKATSLDWPRGRGHDPHEMPEGPILRPFGGGGGGGRWNHTFYVWPLPPGDQLTFVCEWPSAGIGLTRAETEAEPIRLAAAEAVRVFEAGADRRGAESSGWSTHAVSASTGDPEPDDPPRTPPSKG